MNNDDKHLLLVMAVFYLLAIACFCGIASSNNNLGD